MFDSKKIQLNHIRSSNHQDYRTNKLFFILSEMLLNRAFDRIKLTDKKNILEIGARNNSLSNLFHVNNRDDGFVDFVKVGPVIETNPLRWFLYNNTKISGLSRSFRFSVRF